MARSPPEKNYHWLWGKLSTTFSNVTDVAQWATPSYSQPQPATDNGVRDGRSNWLTVTIIPMGSTPWAPRAQYKSVQPLPGIDHANFSMRGNHLVYAATQGII